MERYDEELLLKTGAAYIRVSDERQDEYSPDSQLKKIREYAAKEGYIIPDEFVFYDDGISGKSAKKRDDFNRMIAIAKDKNHPFDLIYVWKFSRFARNQEESMVYKNLLLKKGVSVVSVSEPIPEGPFGTLIERIIEWMDEFYLVNLGTEVVRGMTEKVTRGEPTGAPPYGYIMREGRYYPDEESGAASVIREIFQRFADGDGMRSIAISLGERGIRTKDGNIPDNRWIQYILNNPCYIGKLRWSLGGQRAVSKRDYQNESIMVIDALHDPIISTELWDKCQNRIAELKKKYPKYARQSHPAEYMLKGLVRCSACGATLVFSGAVSGKQKTKSLQCHNYARGSCKVSHSITLPKIEAAFISGLEEIIGSKSFNIVPSSNKKSDPSQVDYNKLIAAEERRLERAREAYLAEIDTIEQYAKNKKAITDRIDGLKAKRDREVVEKIDIDAYAAKASEIAEFIKRDDVTPAAKNEALRSIINKVIYNKANGNLAIYFHAL